MRNMRKLVSVLLVAMLLITTVAAAGITASAAGGTLASYYKTNPDSKFGKQATITVDGSASDWSEDMMIARSAAWDVANHYKGAHENSLIDGYALFGAYDSSNLYIGMQYVNTTDTWQNSGDASLMDGGKMGNIPLMLALSVDPSSTGMTGKVGTGKGIWDIDVNFETHVDHLFYFSAQPGQGNPAMFTAADSSGNSDYDAHCKLFTSAGITYKLADTNICSEIWGLDYSEDPDDVYDDAANWVDFKTFKGKKGVHDTKYDTFYEMAIPLSALGIDANYIATNGIGAMMLGTRGQSGMDCVPFDGTAMLDNALGSYGSDSSTSHEKDDVDVITAPLARIGAQGSTPIPTTPTTPTTPATPTTPTQPTAPNPGVTTADVNVTSNYFGSSSVTDLKVGDTFTATYTLNANMGVSSAQWSLSYDSSALKLLTSGSALCPSGGTVNAEGNPVYGNFTNAQNPFSFSGGKTFVQAEFQVLKAGATNVALTVEELNLSYKSGNNLYIGSVVENSQLQNITSQSGFGSAKVSGTSTAETGSIVEDGITVNAKSNFFKTASATFDADTDQVTVAYRLQSNMGVVNTQWSLRYDTSKLRYSSVSMPKATGAYFDQPATGVVTGNFTSLNMVSYSTMDDFAVITFDVIGSGETDVTLNVMNLALGYKSGSQVTEGYLVDNGTVKNLKNTTGFTNLSYSTESKVYAEDVMLGDVNGDGRVNVYDATALQRYLAEYTTLSADRLRAADVIRDGKVNVNDLTQIQRYCAYFINSF